MGVSKMASEARVGFALMSQSSYRAGFSIGLKLIQSLCKSTVPDQTDTLVILGHLCQETLVRMLFVLILDRLVLCYTIKFQEATFVNLYGIQVVHLSQLAK
jgi:hypothetical protein